MTKTLQSSSVLGCAHRCLYWQSVEKICNSFHYDANTAACQLATLTFLEDPSPGETSLAVMVDTEAAERLEMKCRGGERCCVRNNVRMCGEGEGDCHQDSDCQQGLVCGLNNCNKTVSLTLTTSPVSSQQSAQSSVLHLAGRTVGPGGRLL